ncbi:MAG: 3'-5' exonuclease [Anaerolineales bacterium]|nr:3'-5' exonuclease [Anaerolineales bacterium]
MREDDRKRAIEIAKSKIAGQPLYLDTETTGLGPGDEIVEISILDSEGEVLLDSLVRPVKKIPPDAVAIHGITDETVRDALTWADIWPEVARVIEGMEIAIYNAEFDLRMMRQSHGLYRLQWDLPTATTTCIMHLYAQFYGAWNPSHRTYRWQSLENAGRQCNISLPNTHRAKDDAALARAVLHHIARASM